MTTSDCLVVGGGINGLLSACECLQAGLNVTVLEPEQVAGAASWAAGGILSPLQPWTEPQAILDLSAVSQQMYPLLIKKLVDKTGIDAEYQLSGMLFAEPEDHAPIRAWAQRYAMEYQQLGLAEVKELEPQLTCVSDAAYLPGIAQVRSTRLLKAVRLYLEKAGVGFVNVSDSVELIIHRDRCEGLRLADRQLRARCVVLAAGAWSSELLRNLEPALPVEPVRGQMLAYQTAPDTIKHMVLRNRQYLIPRRDGLLLAGSTLETVGFDYGTTAAAAQDLHNMAADLLPQLAAMSPLHHWSGLRPATPDGLPYIGAHPTLSGLYLNYGHYRNGILLAPASARLLVQIMAGRAGEGLAAAFAPARLLRK